MVIVECFVSAATNGGHYEITSREALYHHRKTQNEVSLEEAFWRGLKDIAASRRVPLRNLVASIDTERQHGNLSSAIRLFVLDYYQKGTASPNRSFVAADQHQAAH